jgi:hypothetical protein
MRHRVRPGAVGAAVIIDADVGLAGDVAVAGAAAVIGHRLDGRAVQAGVVAADIGPRQPVQRIVAESLGVAVQRVRPGREISEHVPAEAQIGEVSGLGAGGVDRRNVFPPYAHPVAEFQLPICTPSTQRLPRIATWSTILVNTFM